jgi:signal peptidase I
VTDKTESTDAPQDESPAVEAQAGTDSENDGKSERKKSTLKEAAILIVIAVAIYTVMLTFVARPYLIPSESMEPTLHGCTGCTGDRVMVDKVVYRFGSPQPGDVIVFKGPASWAGTYKSIRSKNLPVRWLQNALSSIGFVPPDEFDLVKRVIAVGGQTVECRYTTGLTVDGKPLNQPFLDPKTMGVDPSSILYKCLGPEFGPVTVPEGRLWVMGDNRTNSADSRFHCTNNPTDLERQIHCTGDPMSGTVPVENVIGKERFIAWPPSRWGGILTTIVVIGLVLGLAIAARAVWVERTRGQGQ